MSKAGIDYGGYAGSNRDPVTGIHYGVIRYNSLADWAWERFEDDYGDPACPKCGGDVTPSAEVEDDTLDTLDIEQLKDFLCVSCVRTFWDHQCMADESIGFSYEGEGYTAHDAFDKTCVFVIKSPYYTYTRFCSPCAPGAGDLDGPLEPDEGVKTFCFGPDWFEDGECPYRVWRVVDDVEVT